MECFTECVFSFLYMPSHWINWYASAFLACVARMQVYTGSARIAFFRDFLCHFCFCTVLDIDRGMNVFSF